ncbi:hypothetical protein JQ615_31000 [Bradyrhizobium jicamae]|uniref:Uncharacterized protein n=1 Tax=Bradyrhizobium jicamae TaxID=280332 RepID=A0ABS5FT62_9BRAD|nr:hypothetical protein [Bradyrhizobium jicamae]MBR0799809.1 hypothetical protein [Bradyrhizobium jicamae]
MDEQKPLPPGPGAPHEMRLACTPLLGGVRDEDGHMACALLQTPFRRCLKRRWVVLKQFDRALAGT